MDFSDSTTNNKRIPEFEKADVTKSGVFGTKLNFMDRIH